MTMLKPELPEYVRDLEIKYALKQFVRQNSIKSEAESVSSNAIRRTDERPEQFN
ncbi:hypothetical protein [Alicyclobacillus acidiphilus]|uniref:hypothetical protein n=1 Tax=Alicyclobacillus acidiphilus TaxID=182455 RepID=UPI0012ECEE7D|nr:hypothetical protein [Alicyclobacillus acidiphilus]